MYCQKLCIYDVSLAAILLTISHSPDWVTQCFLFSLKLLGRMGTLEECGQACLYLAAEATFTTGIDLLLTGGAELTYGKKTQVENV